MSHDCPDNCPLTELRPPSAAPLRSNYGRDADYRRRYCLPEPGFRHSHTPSTPSFISFSAAQPVRSREFLRFSPVAMEHRITFANSVCISGTILNGGSDDESRKIDGFSTVTAPASVRRWKLPLRENSLVILLDQRRRSRSDFETRSLSFSRESCGAVQWRSRGGDRR